MAARGSIRRLGATVALECALITVGTVVALASRGGVSPGLVLALGVTAMVLVLAGIAFRRIGIVATGVVALGAAYLVARLGESVSLGVPAAFGVGLLAVLLLGAAAIDERSPVAADVSARRRRACEALAALAGGLVAAAVVSIAGGAGRGAGVPLFLVGAAAAVGAVVLLAVMKEHVTDT